MKIIAQGLMSGDLPWEIIFIGIALAVSLEFLGLNSLTVAVGFYLPLTVSTPIMIGGIVRWGTELFANKEVKEKRDRTGTLFASGLIAGEVVPGFINPEAPVFTESKLLSFLLFRVLAVLLFAITMKKRAKDELS
jgi:uncharacterized oligopeptide transporter (OPT) family protein